MHMSKSLLILLTTEFMKKALETNTLLVTNTIFNNESIDLAGSRATLSAIFETVLHKYQTSVVYLPLRTTSNTFRDWLARTSSQRKQRGKCMTLLWG